MRKRISMLRTQAFRRLRLQQLVGQHGASYIADKMKWKGTTFVSQMCGPNPTRPITEHTARRIEFELKLPHLSLDR